MVRKMFFCMRLHTQDCEVTQSEMSAAVYWIYSVVSPLKGLCEFGAIERTTEAIVKSKVLLPADEMKTMIMEAFKEESMKEKGKIFL